MLNTSQHMCSRGYTPSNPEHIEEELFCIGEVGLRATGTLTRVWRASRRDCFPCACRRCSAFAAPLAAPAGPSAAAPSCAGAAVVSSGCGATRSSPPPCRSCRSAWSSTRPCSLGIPGSSEGYSAADACLSGGRNLLLCRRALCRAGNRAVLNHTSSPRPNFPPTLCCTDTAFSTNQWRALHYGQYGASAYFGFLTKCYQHLTHVETNVRGQS